jgi:hypothetical protein
MKKYFKNSMSTKQITQGYFLGDSLIMNAVNFYRNIGFEITSLGEKYPGVERFQCILLRDSMTI